MKRFAYLFDPLFLACCALYAANRWLIKPHVHLAFFHNWFNDTLLIPCAMPPLLFVHDLLHLRPRNAWPTALEIAAHLVGWSILFEIIGPHIMHTTGDPWDVVAYAAGALFAWAWWQVAQRAPVPVRTADFDRLAPTIAGWNGCLPAPNFTDVARHFSSPFPRPAMFSCLAKAMGVFSPN